ncbi:hypothetical protein RDE2_45420 [Rhodococcus sp. RDE2]|nr:MULTISPECIES: transposase [Rhodococcus]BDB62748.1 hypothetical protein RDE2_45420 [Rhodococcus sp. RDE2]
MQGGAPTAATEAEASERFDEFTVKWGPRYPAITRLWRSAWSEFVPFLDYDPEIRRAIPQGDPGPQTLLQGASRVEVSVLGDPSTGPGREGKSTMGNEVEAGTERFAITFEGREK